MTLNRRGDIPLSGEKIITALGGTLAMATVGCTPEVRKALSVSDRVDEISDEVEAEQHNQMRSQLQALILDCASLAIQWRSVVEYLSKTMESARDIDYHTIGDTLRPAANRTRNIYASVTAMDRSLGCSDVSDLKLAIVECENIIRWLESWPTNDDSRRIAARESIARGEFCTDAELSV